MIWEKNAIGRFYAFWRSQSWPPLLHLDRKSEQANIPADADCNQSDPGNSPLLGKIWTNLPADENKLIVVESMCISVGKFSKDLRKWVKQKSYCAL